MTDGVARDAEMAAEISSPGLLSAALRVYLSAMVAELDRAGLDDMPRTGYRVIGSLARAGSTPGAAAGSSLQEVARELGMSKQAAGQLVDVLVARDYCVRLADTRDRRRVLLRLSERGLAAARAIRDAVRLVDQTLAGSVGGRDLATVREVLTALADLGRTTQWPGDRAPGARPHEQHEPHGHHGA